MRAVFIDGPHKLRIADVPVPTPGPRDVLTRVKSVGICGTDHAIYTGATSFLETGLITYPMRPGHEWSGIVEAVGEEVTAFKPGDRVVGDTSVSCGECAFCMSGQYNICQYTRCVGTVNTWDGAYADYMLMPARHMYKIPDGLSLEEAALVEPAATALYTVQRAYVKAGDTVVVHGTGAIGLVAVQCAKIAGAARVILTGRTDGKLAVGKQLGADVVLNTRKCDVTAEILGLTGGLGAHAVLEASGSIDALEGSVHQVRPGGAISVVGIYEKRMNNVDIDRFVFYNITLNGVNGSPNQFGPTIGTDGCRADLRGADDYTPFPAGTSGSSYGSDGHRPLSVENPAGSRVEPTRAAWITSQPLWTAAKITPRAFDWESYAGISLCNSASAIYAL